MQCCVHEVEGLLRAKECVDTEAGRGGSADVARGEAMHSCNAMHWASIACIKL